MSARRSDPSKRILAVAAAMSLCVPALASCTSGTHQPRKATASAQPAASGEPTTSSPRPATPHRFEIDLFSAQLPFPGLGVVILGRCRVHPSGPCRSLLYSTSDLGRTWRSITPFGDLPDHPFSDAFFLDDRHGWAVAADIDSDRSFVFGTTDGGRTWFRSTPVYATVDHAGDQLVVDFTDPLHGRLVTLTQVGEGASVARTSDGGRTWSHLRPLPSVALVRFASDRVGVLGGYGATGPLLFFTSDGGAHWLPANVPHPRGSQLADGDLPRFFGPRIGVVAVTLSRPHRRPLINFYETSDGGQNWTLRSSIPVGRTAFGNLPRVDPGNLATAKVWWVLEGTPPTVMLTADGGRTWRSSKAPAGAVEISATSARDAWLTTAGRSDSSGRLYATTDGGKTWRLVALPLSA